MDKYYQVRIWDRIWKRGDTAPHAKAEWESNKVEWEVRCVTDGPIVLAGVEGGGSLRLPFVNAIFRHVASGTAMSHENAREAAQRAIDREKERQANEDAREAAEWVDVP